MNDTALDLTITQQEDDSRAGAAKLAQNCSRLFSLPDVYLRLQRLINDEKTTITQMAELIALDAGLSARLLKIANSSFYNFPAQIHTISRAITLIGSNELNNLVLATSVANAFKGVPEDLIDMDSFWRHNIDCGLVARQLGKQIRASELEQLFVIGLLHNLGKLVVITEKPDLARQVLENDGTELPWEREQNILGYTFADVGAELFKAWQLPEETIEAVLNQHKPECTEGNRTVAALIHIGSRAASWMDQETRDAPGVDFIEQIDEWAWAQTGLEISDLDAAIEYAQMEAWNLLGMITGYVP